MQKYPQIIELFDCILNMFVFMFLCSINFSISLEHFQLQNYRNKQFHYFYKIRQSNVYQYLHIHQGLLHKLHFLFY